MILMGLFGDIAGLVVGIVVFYVFIQNFSPRTFDSDAYDAALVDWEQQVRMHL